MAAWNLYGSFWLNGICRWWGDGGAGGEGVSSDRRRAALQKQNRTAAVAPLGDFTHLESVHNCWTNYSWFWILFVLFHMEWDFAQVSGKWNPEFQPKRERYNYSNRFQDVVLCLNVDDLSWFKMIWDLSNLWWAKIALNIFQTRSGLWK